MSESQQPDETERTTMTIPQLAQRAGVSRSLIHRLASNPDEGWPPPKTRPGSTRPEYDIKWFDSYWEQRQNSIGQGRRTDLRSKKMTFTQESES